MNNTPIAFCVIVLTVAMAGCFDYDCGYDPGRVEVRFYPEIDKENVTKYMENLSLEYNFTIIHYDRQKHASEGYAWEVLLSVPEGSEKWIATELEKKEPIHTAELLWADC